MSPFRIWLGLPTRERLAVLMGGILVAIGAWLVAIGAILLGGPVPA